MVETRGASAALMAELAKPAFYPIWFAHVAWPSDPLWAHTKRGIITWGGQDWTGVGDFGQVTLPSEEYGTASQPATMALVGLPETLRDLLAQAERDMLCTVYFGCTTARGSSVLVSDPVEIFRGLAGKLTETLAKSDTGTTHGAALSAYPGPSQRAVGVLYHTDESHQQLHPGDTLFRHAAGVEAAYRAGIKV